VCAPHAEADGAVGLVAEAQAAARRATAAGTAPTMAASERPGRPALSTAPKEAAAERAGDPYDDERV